MVFSKFFYTIIFIILVSLKVYPNDVYESKFFDVEVVTLDANKSKSFKQELKTAENMD